MPSGIKKAPTPTLPLRGREQKSPPEGEPTVFRPQGEKLGG